MGVRMIAISNDTIDEVAKGKIKMSPHITFLADPDLRVTEQYNLRHEKAITPTPGRGIVRPLAIPTTFFVGADGIVKWIDQTDNYQVRSDADRVLAAIRMALGA